MTHLTDDQLAAFLEHEMAAAEHGQAREHLEQCPECRELLSSYQLLSGRMIDKSQVAHPDQFVRQVMARISPPTQKVTWYDDLWLRVSDWIPQGLGGLVAMLLVVMQLNGINLTTVESEQVGLSAIASEVIGYELEPQDSDFSSAYNIDEE